MLLAPYGMKGKTVLVVDDNPLISWALGKEFSSLGATVTLTGTGRTALDEIRAARYDLVFLDVHLPDANGIDLLVDIGTLSPGTRLIVMSADATEENRRRAIEGGVFQFIEKPFDISEIRKVLRTVAGDDLPRRKSPRYFCRIPVRLSIVTPVPEEPGLDVHNLTGVMADVGDGGLRVHTDYPLRAGQHLRVRIEAENDPLSKFLPPRRMAEVVWVEPKGGDVTSGLRFLC